MSMPSWQRAALRQITRRLDSAHIAKTIALSCSPATGRLAASNALQHRTRCHRPVTSAAKPPPLTALAPHRLPSPVHLARTYHAGRFSITAWQLHSSTVSQIRGSNAPGRRFREPSASGIRTDPFRPVAACCGAVSCQPIALPKASAARPERVSAASDALGRRTSRQCAASRNPAADRMRPVDRRHTCVPAFSR